MKYAPRLLVIAATAAALSATAGPPETWRVVSVSDGDTVRCLAPGNREVKIRLSGIDAPETGQPFGTVARDRLRELVLRRDVLVHNEGLDKYGRTLARLQVGQTDIATTMVAEGLAWHYDRFSDDPQLAQAQREAQAAGRGLWRDRSPVPPWEWRKAESSRRQMPAGR